MNLRHNRGHLGFLFETMKGNRLQTYSENTWEKRWEMDRHELLIWGSEPMKESLPYVDKSSSRSRDVSSVEN